MPSNSASPRRRLVQAHQRQADRGLARARFADEPERLALGQLERHVLHRLELALAEQALARIEALAEVAARRGRSGRPATCRACAPVRFGARAPPLHEVVDHRQPHGPAVELRPACSSALRVRVLRRSRTPASPGPAPGSRRCASRPRSRRSRRPRARSCVMNSTDIWCCFCSSAMRSRICFWIVTSSAVVGSSAISSFGSQAIAIAIITRCCWPPDICDGIGVDRAARARECRPRRSSSIARSRACAAGQAHVQRAAPRSSWKPTVNTGLSDVIGSWKIIEMSAPRSSRSSRGGSVEQVAPAVDDLALRDRRSSSRAAAGPGSPARSPTCRCPIRRPARRCVFVGMSKRDALHRLEHRVARRGGTTTGGCGR